MTRGGEEEDRVRMDIPLPWKGLSQQTISGARTPMRGAILRHPGIKLKANPSPLHRQSMEN
jgi:hypothetical protein